MAGQLFTKEQLQAVLTFLALSTGAAQIGESGGSTVEAVLTLLEAIETTTSTNFAAGSHSTILCDASSGAVTVDLPAAASSAGKIYSIKAIDVTNTVTIDANGAELIDFATTLVLSPVGDSVKLQCDGTQWWAI